MAIAEYSPATFPDTWFMFCGCDILCSSFGYQLAFGLSGEMLGDEGDLLDGGQEVLEEEEEEDQNSRTDICKLVVSSMSEYTTVVEALQTEVSSKIAKYDQLIDNVNLKLAKAEVVLPLDPDVHIQSLLDHLLSRLSLSALAIQPRLKSDTEKMLTHEVEATCRLSVEVLYVYEQIHRCLTEEVEKLCGLGETIDDLLTYIRDTGR